MGLSHLNERGEVRMVDVADKPVTIRTASASAVVYTAATSAIRSRTVSKGDVCAVARIAGIMAAKRTPDLIPMCHPIAIHGVEVQVEPSESSDEVHISATVRTADRTGVEMEALTAVSIAGLTVIDMTKAIDKAASVSDVRVESKSGGRSGEWRR
jgi:cyclic pyranopterin phosphate synthase